MDLNPAVSKELAQAVDRVGQVDILVAIPAFNNEDTVSSVMKMAAEGLSTFYRSRRSAIFVCDGGSLDDTKAVATNTDIGLTVNKIVATYRGQSGKGNALRAVFQAARSLGAQACVLMDADLRSVTPEWVHNLAEPVISHGFDLVTPYYRRYKYDGTITNIIVFPMISSLFGKRIRQPIGGDFGLSKKLIDFFAYQDVWDNYVGQFGIDIWMTVSSLAEGFKVCQANLGAKVHDAKDPAFSLGPMYVHVLSTLFSGMGKYESVWKSIEGSQDVEIFGSSLPWEPDPIPISVTRLIKELRTGVQYFGPLYERIFDAESYSRLERLAGGNGYDPDEFHMPADLWARILYDLAIQYNLWEANTHKLIDLSAPLYYGRIASLANEIRLMDADEAEQFIISEARTLEEMKPYLLERWDTMIAAERAVDLLDR
jgi:glycosyltransferase involved in cell wall biosynthesis